MLTATLGTGWFAIGPDHPVYALVVASVTFGVGPLLGNPLERHLPRRWFDVPRGEARLHRVLGVRMFGRVLERSGWNRAVADPMRPFDGTRAELPVLVRHLRSNAAAHGAGFLTHAVLAAVALGTGHPRGTLWILLPGVVIHLYPVLLQRSIMIRARPLMDQITFRVQRSRRSPWSEPHESP